MKTKILLLFAMAFALLFATGCANEDTAQENNPQENGTEGMTEFAVNDNTTRTTGIYSGSGVDFYWTEGDKLWVNNTAVTPPLIQSVRDNISSQLAASGDTKTATAKFYFPGTFTAASYPVRYTGYGNSAGDKVTIANTQNQSSPNDGSHIGKDGDCGTAIATKSGGRYNFTLNHEASYITFVPYATLNFASSVKVTKIKVTANRPIAGTYNFSDSGLDTSAPTETSDSIVLNLTDATATTGFSIPSASTPSENAAIMVLAPGTYSTFTVEYTLYDTDTKVGGTITKEYSNLTFTAGKNKKVATNLAVTVHTSNEYYTWDAAVDQHYWKGYENFQTFINGASGTNYPQNSLDPRWYNTISYPNHASRSAKNCPNVNEIRWYVEYGDPYWEDTFWSMGGHLYRGGTWLKKQSVIAAEHGTNINAMKAAAPNGTDYTTAATDAQYENLTITHGKPSNINNYFYLPDLGCYQNGAPYKVGDSGFYWSSTPSPWSSTGACRMITGSGGVSVYDHGTNRPWGFRLWTAQ